MSMNLFRKRNRPMSDLRSLGKLSLSSDAQVQAPRRSFRFMVRVILPDDQQSCRTFFVRIPSNELEWLSAVNLANYVRHDHLRCDPSRFRSLHASQIGPYYLASGRYIPHSSAVAVGREVYTLFYDSQDMSLHFTSLHSRTAVASSFPPLISPNRFHPKILSLRGKIYLLGGLVHPSHIGPQTLSGDLHLLANQPQPFGEVFDPQTKTWSALKQPPKAAKLVKRSKLFVASLGNSEAKFLVFDYEASQPTCYIYDIVAENWCTYCPPISFCNGFKPRFIFGEVVFNTHDDNIYWIDERKGDIYAFDWKAMKVYSGPIVGVEHISFLKTLKDCSLAIALHHLWEDFFCLVWSEVISVSSSSTWDDTNIHFTFLRVIKGPNSNQLTAFVLGCFMDSVGYHCRMSDAISI